MSCHDGIVISSELSQESSCVCKGSPPSGFIVANSRNIAAAFAIMCLRRGAWPTDDGTNTNAIISGSVGGLLDLPVDAPLLSVWYESRFGKVAQIVTPTDEYKYLIAQINMSVDGTVSTYYLAERERAYIQWTYDVARIISAAGLALAGLLPPDICTIVGAYLRVPPLRATNYRIVQTYSETIQSPRTPSIDGFSMPSTGSSVVMRVRRNIARPISTRPSISSTITSRQC